MKKILPLLSLLILGTSCKSTSFTQTLPNGCTVVFRDSRFVLATAAQISAQLDPTNGVVRVEVGVQSKPDAEFTSAVISAAVSAAVKGAKP